MSLSPISGGGPGSGSGGGIGGSTGATDNAILRADGVGGSTVQASTVTLGDTGAFSGISTLVASSVITSGAGYLVNDGPGGDEKVQVAASFLLAADAHVKFYNDADISSGSADVGLDRAAAGVLRVTNGSTGGGGIEFTEIADLTAPAANKARLYCRDNGSGKSQLVVRFPSGAVQVLATEP